MANGGVIAGMLAGEGPAEVTVLRPVPVDVPLTATNGRLLDAAGTLLAEAVALGDDERRALEEVALSAPRRTVAEARAAAAATPLAEGHPFPTCFGCGRQHPTGLHCLAGPAGDGVWAVTFTPESEDPRLVWAALDCPSSAPHAEPNPESPLVLGRISGWILRRPVPGEDHVVVAWSTGEEGRRRYSGSAILDADGTACAVARATWVALTPHAGIA
jgi:hypothetical protein